MVRTRLAVAVLACTALAACTRGADERSAPTTTTTAPLTCPHGAPAPVVDDPADVDLRAPATEAIPPRDGALDLGTLLPLTGDLSFLAGAATAGVARAVADVNQAGGVLGAPVSVHPADSAPERPGTAEAEVDRLLAAGVDAVVGPISSGVAGRVLGRVRAGGGLLASPGATSDVLDELDTDDRMFRTVATDRLQGHGLASLVRADGARTASLVVRGDDHGRAIADAFETAFSGAGGTVTGRMAHDPIDTASTSAADLVLDIDAAADAIVVIGLAESARVLDALVAAGHAPRERPVYASDGLLGDRLGDHVADPDGITCLRGVLPFTRPSADFADRLRGTAGLDDGALDHAAEAHDAVVTLALATEVASSDEPAAVAAAMAGVTRGGTPCEEVAECLALARAGTDLVHVGASGRLRLDAGGNRTEARLAVATFGVDGRVTRSAIQRTRLP